MNTRTRVKSPQALEVTSGTWISVASAPLPTGHADSETTAKFPQIALPTPYAHGAFRIVYRVTWSDAQSGTNVATTTVAPQAGELTCWTSVVSCTATGDRIVG